MTSDTGREQLAVSESVYENDRCADENRKTRPSSYYHNNK